TGRAGQSWHTLSGGERQRTQIARALAQEPRELLLDEPTNHLDIQHQLDLLDLVVGLPIATVIALHDLNLAAMYCDRLLVLREGGVVAEGTPGEVLTPSLIKRVYGVRAEVTHEPGHPVIRFLRRTHGLPRTPPSVCGPSFVLKMRRSVPQMEAARTRTSRSSPTTVGSATSSTASSPGRRSTAALMTHLRRHRAG
ncbi:ABC transporter ATP-binding protein, partial [Streptomyces asiaticus]